MIEEESVAEVAEGEAGEPDRPPIGDETASMQGRLEGKRRHRPVRQPTFDEREEAGLAEEGGLAPLASPQYQQALTRIPAPVVCQGPPPGVEGRILQQITEFDRSFTSVDSSAASLPTLEPPLLIRPQVLTSMATMDAGDSPPCEDAASAMRWSGAGGLVVAGTGTEGQTPTPQRLSQSSLRVVVETGGRESEETEPRRPHTLGPRRLHCSPDTRPSRAALRYSDHTLLLRCSQCNQPLESYDEDTQGMSIVCLSTFVHREPSIAAPFLLRILGTVSRIASRPAHPWERDWVLEEGSFVPGNARSVARQHLRVLLHQLAPNAIFLQLFSADIQDPHFFQTMASALADFPELNPVMAIQSLLDNLTDQWPVQGLNQILYNLSEYLGCVSMEHHAGSWATTLPLFESLFRAYLGGPAAAAHHPRRPTPRAQAVEQSREERRVVGEELPWLLSILTRLLKVPALGSLKSAPSLVDWMGKVLTACLHSAPVPLPDLLALLSASNRAFTKERERQTLSRVCLTELVQAIKFKVNLPESNYLTLIKLCLQDAGEYVGVVGEEEYCTGAADVARGYLSDFLDFVSDLHVLSKVKAMGRTERWSEDTLGGDMKAALAQLAAMEIARAAPRDPRFVLRYLPWLLTPPAVTQQGPAEFVECVTRVRTLSWLLGGALAASTLRPCTPIPINVSTYIADHIQFVLGGFAEQSKESVVHMSALFHAFHLCQLWTVYCEMAEGAESAGSGDGGAEAVLDFWARLTPAILQLLSHSKVLADMVNLHFLNTIEALQECQSSVLCRLYPMWQPVLSAYHSSLPSQLQVRLEACENALPVWPRLEEGFRDLRPLLGAPRADRKLLPWLKRVRFKISQIELQSSHATQMYTV